LWPSFVFIFNKDGAGYIFIGVAFMKKLVLTLMTLALLAGVIGCSKQQQASTGQRQITVAYS
jgi:hypothetical protein